MKKILAVMLLLTMMFSLCACGSESAEQLAAPAEDKASVIGEADDEPVVETQDEIADAEKLFYEGSFEEAFPLLSAHEDEAIPSVTALLARAYYFGLGTETDTDKALELLKKADESGSIAAKYLLADAASNVNGAKLTLDETDELYKDFVSAAKSMDPADPDYGVAMTYLARCYADGKGAAKDSDKALDAAAKAAAAGNLSPFEQMTLAKVFEDCAPNPEDTAAAVAENLNTEVTPPAYVCPEAQELYAKAADALKALADAGNARAQKLLGDLCFNGRGGIEQDYAKALALYEQAADQDYADAQAQLGYMYQNGTGVELSYEKAMEWNNRAAQQGNSQGQAQIGYMYHMGLGVTQNLDEAGRWYTRAAQQGDSWAADMLILTEVTNPQSVFEAHA